MVDKTMLPTVVPLVVMVVVVSLRLRSMSRPQPLRSARMWIVPAVLVLLGILMLIAKPLSPVGWAVSLAALALGAALGWRRGKMIRIWRDETSGEPMQLASPAAMVFLLVVIAARYLVRAYFGVGSGSEAAMDPRALIATDALLTFAIGLVVATRAELFLRMRQIAPA
jgi:membrane protein CcdC involved in cytochrome C biogenesis